MRKQQNHEPDSTNEPESALTVHLWTYQEAVSAVPYVRAIVRSLREHWLELQRARLQLRRMDARPGRPDRQALILRADAVRQVELAQVAFDDTFGELDALDVFCFDPVQGVALIPFGQGDDLAWFVFELFAPQGLDAWRFHTDPQETRRPLAENQNDVVAQVFAKGVNDVPHHRP